MAGSRKYDIFISHAGPDDDWADWVTERLEGAGYRVIVDRHWRRGENWVQRMEEALDESDWMVALYSRVYFENKYSKQELRAWWSRPDGDDRLIPLRIEPFDEIPTIFRPVLYADVFGLSEVATVRALMHAVERVGMWRAERTAKPVLGQAFSAPPRNAAFTGRSHELELIRRQLQAGDRTVVQALHGLGGVGKTQVATEFVHRYRSDYDQVWWVDAERPELVDGQLSAFAVEAGVASPETPIPEAVDRLRAALRENSRWLIVFDNAGSADELQDSLPSGGGHILITSRDANWRDVGQTVNIGPFTRAESVEMLRNGVGALTEAQAGTLAGQLGNLPLAIAQAVGVLAGSKMPLDDYQLLLTSHPQKAMQLAGPGSYGTSLAQAVEASLRRLAQENPAAWELARVCALLGPEPVPLDLFTGSARKALPPALAALNTAAALSTCAEAVRTVGLAFPASPGSRQLQLHRLTRSVIADGMDQSERRAVSMVAENIVSAAQPDDGSNPRLWVRWRQLMPHLLALRPARSANPLLRNMASAAVWYLLSAGDVRSADLTAVALYDELAETLGTDHPDTMNAGVKLAACRYQLEDYAAARALDETIWKQRQRVLGKDHPDTLTSASDLALDLRAEGVFERAKEINEQVWAARYRLLGRVHPHTLTSQHNLALDLLALDDLGAARRLLEECYSVRQHELGKDHPDTLTTGSNLAEVGYEEGDLVTAERLQREILAKRRAVLSNHHPDVAESARRLAKVLRALGKGQEAKQIEESVRPARRKRPRGARRR